MSAILPRLRKLWFNLHLWLGIGLALVIIPICLTGSYEVWQDEIDAAMHPARQATTVGPLLAPSAYLGAAQAAFGERARVSSLRLPGRAGGPVTVVGLVGGGRSESRPGAGEGAGPARPPAGPGRRPTLTAWLDPGSARVLDVADTAKSFKMTMHRLHGSLLIQGGPGSGVSGRQIVGWIGWGLLASALTGVWLWWPRGAFVKGLRYRRTPDTLLNLHHLVGFWISIPLAVLALTGALIAFPQTARSLVGAVAPVSPQLQRGPGGPFGGGMPAGRTRLSPDEASRLAQDAATGMAPGARLTGLSLPTRGRNASWRVQFEAAGRPLNIAVDDAAGEARPAPERVLLLGDAAIRWNRRLHDGDDIGLIWKLIITLAGLAPALLGVTGVIVWARRQLRKLAMRRRLARPNPAAQPSPAE